MHRPSTVTAAVLASFVISLAACSKSSSVTATSTSAPAVSTAPSSAPAAAGLVPLASVPAGTAALTWDATTKVVTAKIDMYGFAPGSSHAMHIHTGSCLNQVNPPVIPFPDITADTTGVVKTTVTSSAAPSGLPTPAYLNIHLAPGAQLGAPGSQSFTPISCADIPAGTAAAGPAALTMAALPQPGQHPQGSATLTYDSLAHTLKVEVKATGLPPNKAHANHIHLGSCMSQGAVKYPLTELAADASGSADVTTTVTGVDSAPPTSGWYVNVHLGAGTEILSGSQPTLLFAPILCGDVKG